MSEKYFAGIDLPSELRVPQAVYAAVEESLRVGRLLNREQRELMAQTVRWCLENRQKFTKREFFVVLLEQLRFQKSIAETRPDAFNEKDRALLQRLEQNEGLQELADQVQQKRLEYAATVAETNAPEPSTDAANAPKQAAPEPAVPTRMPADAYKQRMSLLVKAKQLPEAAALAREAVGFHSEDGELLYDAARIFHIMAEHYRSDEKSSAYYFLHQRQADIEYAIDLYNACIALDQRLQKEAEETAPREESSTESEPKEALVSDDDVLDILRDDATDALLARTNDGAPDRFSEYATMATRYRAEAFTLLQCILEEESKQDEDAENDTEIPGKK